MRKLLSVTAVAGPLVMAVSSFAGGGYRPYEDSKVEARLNVDVDKSVDKVHFVRDNAAPSVYTKVYRLKHADPMEMRGFLRRMVESRSVDSADTGIWAMKFMDGVGFIIVSAEEYRFAEIEHLVETLDKKDFAALSGQPEYFYQPKFRSANDVAALVNRVGATTKNVDGYDLVMTDPALNMIYFKSSIWSRATIDEVLKEYDTPLAEIRARVTVYELYAENDTKLGLDFQAWKNNDGIDLFSVGGRWMRNATSPFGELARNGRNNNSMFNFNPKWNTKYVDFLASKGKAKVLNSCDIVLRGGETAVIERTNNILEPRLEKAEDIKSSLTRGFGCYDNSASAANTQFSVGINENGKSVFLDIPAGKIVDVNFLKAEVNGKGRVVAEITRGSGLGAFFTDTFAETTELVSVTDENVKWGEKIEEPLVEKGNRINLDPGMTTFGFRLAMTPSVAGEATMLNVKGSNDSLIGYTSEGKPRIQKGATIDTDFMIANSGSEIMIGGIEKRDVVRVSGGVPILKDLPIIGWVFSTEYESSKRSQLLVVAEVMPTSSDDVVTEAQYKEFRKLDDRLQDAGENNRYGYRQFFIDGERLKKNDEPKQETQQPKEVPGKPAAEQPKAEESKPVAEQPKVEESKPAESQAGTDK
ncbi:MAG: hypothetical protein MJ025_04790 [Victivallaceae bacterium]|nr:hypothetical protein [Victivallaceae bacterium]